MSNKTKYWIFQIIKWFTMTFVFVTLLVLVGNKDILSVKTILIINAVALLVIVLLSAIIYICDNWAKYYKRKKK